MTLEHAIYEVDFEKRPETRRWQKICRWIASEMKKSFLGANKIYRFDGVNIGYSDICVSFSATFLHVLTDVPYGCGFQIEKVWLEEYADDEAAHRFVRGQIESLRKMIMTGVLVEVEN